MRSRGWVWITVMVILALVVAGIGAAAFVGGGDSGVEPQPAASETSPPVVAGAFQLRQVLFQETGRIQKEPPLRPGPAKGGPNATRDLLRIDCTLKPRPMKDDDNVILCDADGFGTDWGRVSCRHRRSSRQRQRRRRPGSGSSRCS